MLAEKRQTYTAEFKHEAVRLVTVHGYGVAEAARNLGINATMSGAGNANKRPERTGPSLGRVVCCPNTKSSTVCGGNKRLRLEREILKKRQPLRRNRLELRYAFMAQHQAQWPVSVMGEVMQAESQWISCVMCSAKVLD